MLDNIRFGLEEEKYIYWHVSMDTNICDLGTKTKETFNVEADNVDYIEFIKGNVIVNEDVDKFIEFYKQTKLQKTNKKIQTRFKTFSRGIGKQDFCNSTDNFKLGEWEELSRCE